MEVLQRKRLDEFDISDNLKYFGNWVNDIESYKQQFSNGKPFSNVVIPNFSNLKRVSH